jgi:hypothetical protein
VNDKIGDRKEAGWICIGSCRDGIPIWVQEKWLNSYKDLFEQKG